MSIVVTCSCGEEFKVSGQQVGESAECPHCGTLQAVLHAGAPDQESAVPQGASSEKKKRSLVLIVGGSILLVLLGLIAAIRIYKSIPPIQNKPIATAPGPQTANVVPAWIVLSQFTQDEPAKFSVDWSVQRGDLAANGQYFLVIELSPPKSATTRYLEFPLEIDSRSGTVKASCRSGIEQAENVTCYIEQRNDSTTARISGLLALNQTPNKSSEKSPADMASAFDLRMDVILSNARIENGMLLVDYETIRDVKAAVLQMIVSTEDNSDYNQFQLIEGLADHTGTIYLDTVYESLLARRPLIVRIETYGSMSGQGEPISNQLRLD